MPEPVAVHVVKYFPLLERTKTHNELYFVGSNEKAAFGGICRGVKVVNIGLSSG